MVTIKSKILFLVACLIETVGLLLAQISGSQFLIIPCLVCFLALALWGAVKGFAVPVMLFFLPFSMLLKIRPGTISFFTFALVLIYVVYIAMGSRGISIKHVIPALLLIGLALTVITVKGYPLANNFILFIASLLMVPFMMRELDDKYDFYWLTLFFSVGIIVAAVSAKFLIVYPNINRYIMTHSLYSTLRWTGYYEDPNFYSAQITAALAGVLIVLLNSNKRRQSIIWTVLLAVLMYCGLLSLSKSFFLISVALLLVWISILMFKSGKLSTRIIVLIMITVAAVIFLSMTVFGDLITLMLARFAGNSTWSDFTTKRTDLWAMYIREFLENPRLYILGTWTGFEHIDGHATHNTILQSIFQFGIVGSIILIVWEVFFIKTLMAGNKIPRGHFMQAVLLLIGSFGPWVALDFLFFDEFFLLPIYVCAGLRYMAKNDVNELTLQ